jgi:hypothetical protein
LLDLSTVRSGIDTAYCWSENAYFDWAVVKLTTVVPDVTPYAVPSTDPSYAKGDPLLMFSTGDDNFAQGSLNVQRCTVMALWQYENIPVETDCDSGGGASGAGQFEFPEGTLSLDPDELVLTFIHVGEGARAVDGSPFTTEDQYNVSVPIQTDLLQAIKELSAR